MAAENGQKLLLSTQKLQGSKVICMPGFVTTLYRRVRVLSWLFERTWTHTSLAGQPFFFLRAGGEKRLVTLARFS